MCTCTSPLPRRAHCQTEHGGSHKYHLKHTNGLRNTIGGRRDFLEPETAFFSTLFPKAGPMSAHQTQDGPRVSPGRAAAVQAETVSNCQQPMSVSQKRRRLCPPLQFEYRCLRGKMSPRSELVSSKAGQSSRMLAVQG